MARGARARKGRKRSSIGLMLTAIVLGIVFLLIQVKEWTTIRME